MVMLCNQSDNGWLWWARCVGVSGGGDVHVQLLFRPSRRWPCPSMSLHLYAYAWPSKIPAIGSESSRCRDDHRARSFVRKRLPCGIHVVPCSYHRRRASASRGLMSSFTTARVALTVTPHDSFTIHEPTSVTELSCYTRCTEPPSQPAGHALTAEAHLHLYLHLHLAVRLLSTTTIAIRLWLELRVP